MRVFTGSCLDPGALPSLPNKSVDHFVADAPYDRRTHEKGRRGCTGYVEPTRPGATRAQFSRARHLGFVPLSADLMRGVAAEYARLARRWVLNFCSVEMVSAWRKALEDAGLEYVRTCFWRKRGCPPQFTGDRPAQAVEAVVCAHPPGRKRWNGRGAHGWFDFDFEPEDDAADVVFEDAIVLNRGEEKIRVHTTQKPLGLMEKLVALFTDPGELVCDPFAGSGTTLVACERLGRLSIGCEISPEYARIAEDRVLAVGQVGALPARPVLVALRGGKVA